MTVAAEDDEGPDCREDVDTVAVPPNGLRAESREADGSNRFETTEKSVLGVMLMGSDVGLFDALPSVGES